jgi:hypothetical protein
MAVGTKCPIVRKYQAHLINRNDIPKMATRLGNPQFYEVKKPDGDKRELIDKLRDIECNQIPKKGFSFWFC